MIKKIIRRLLNKIGLKVYRKKLPQSFIYRKYDAECSQIINRVRSNTMVAREGLIELYHQAVFCEKHNIPGCFVECGVWKGGAVGLMALANLRHSSTRRNIHLFDSFQECPEPDERIDGERAIREVKMWAKNPGTKGNLIPLKGVFDKKGGPGTIKQNKELLEQKIGYDPNYLHYHQGWFQEVLPTAHKDLGPIAILRLDADWYASTKVCLHYLFHKVVSGGFVIIDDYGAYDGCRKAVDEFIEGYGSPLYLNWVNRYIIYIIIP